MATFPRFKYFPKSSNSCTDSANGCPTKAIIRGFNYLFIRCLRDSAEILIAAKNCENPSAKFWLIVLKMLTYFDSSNTTHNFCFIVCLSKFHIGTRTSHRHYSYCIFWILVKFNVCDGISCVLLTFPSTWGKVSISIKLRIV